LQQDLIGHWKFNGNLNDSTPFSNDGTIIGGVSLTTDRLGKANSAYDFNGTTGYIDTGSSALPNRLTVSAWIYMDSLATLQTAVSNARNCCDNTQRGVTLLPRHNRPSASVWGIDGLGGAYVEDPSFDPSYLSINTWYHLAMTYDGSNLRIYVNGVLGATDALSQANNGTASATLKIGRLGSYAGVFMNGKIDDVRYYSRALSDAEMITLYNTYDD